MDESKEELAYDLTISSLNTDISNTYIRINPNHQYVWLANNVFRIFRQLKLEKCGNGAKELNIWPQTEKLVEKFNQILFSMLSYFVYQVVSFFIQYFNEQNYRIYLILSNVLARNYYTNREEF